MKKEKFQEIRPSTLEDYVGQKELIKQLNIYIDSAKMRNECLDHILFSGGAGLGKTTLSQAIANSFGSKIVLANAANMLRPKDIVSYLVTLEEGDFFFIDEIHRLKKEIEEVLYTAMEDFRIDILVDSGSETKPISLDIPKFTLIGATTMKGKISNPLIERFGIDQELREYTEEELFLIINRTANIYNINISKEASFELAKRSRGTPRRANKILKRIIDFAYVKEISFIEKCFLTNILEKELYINSNGLEEKDIKILKTLYYDFEDRAVGIKNLASALNENIETLEYIIEPFLIKNKLIVRTSRGRKITKKGIEIIKE
jgi:Holliday junction DNA helicase RuvB